MDAWVFFLTVAIETLESLYFFDTFLERGEKEGFRKYRFFIYLIMMYAANVTGFWIGMWKIPLFMAGYVILGRLFYKVHWKQAFFFSALNYCMIFLTDFVTYCLSNMREMQGTAQQTWSGGQILSQKSSGLACSLLFAGFGKKGAAIRN